MGSMVTRIDAATIREPIDRADTIPCPLCEQRHVFDLVGDSGMNERCWDRFWVFREGLKVLSIRRQAEQDEAEQEAS
jgi:hypothetical protein